ncbi:MAG: MFS transporter [Gemmobacter sp.]|uniref:MFS transporter n=1 Tax=Gemmobacter sp. TaxID=1898957 RepID=UPI001A4744C2|nr:MFS transporter [Gemmobacter sp.]MBL8561257.1 MFS transporter [Gemmobacter sp.]
MKPISPFWLVLALWGAGLGAAAQFGKISIIFAQAGAIYPLAGPLALGLLVSIVGFPGLIFGTTAGLMVRGLGWRRVLVVALSLGAAVSAVQALFPPMPVMLALRVLEGFSHLAVVVAAPVLIAQVAPVARQGLAMTLWSTFFAVTYTLLAVLAPPLVNAAGPGALLLAHALWMAGFALLLARMLPRDAPATWPRLSLPALARDHRAIYASPRVAAPAMGFVCYTMTYVALLTLLPPLSGPVLQGLLATLLPLVSIAVSLLLGVWLLGRIGAVGTVVLGFVAALIGAAGLALGWGSLVPQLAASLWIGGALGLVQGASFAAIPALNPGPGERAQAAGAIAQLGNLGTTLGTPLLGALIADQGALAVPVFVSLFAVLGIALHLLQAARRQ